MKPKVNFDTLLKRVKQKSRLPGDSTKVNEKITVELKNKNPIPFDSTRVGDGVSLSLGNKKKDHSG